MPRPRIFVSYKRDTNPDEAVARSVFQALSDHFDVFIDQTMLIGTRWAERIEAELRRSDFLIAFLSGQSIHSEMVEAEIKTAHHLAREHGGKPAILPVRLAFREPFQYPLSAYLDPLNWAFWDCATDTPRLIDELMQAVSGGQLTIAAADVKKHMLCVPDQDFLPRPSPAAQLEMPEGTMDTESRFYVERPSDAIAIETSRQQGVTTTIKGPRQMGKSSLLLRTMAAAKRANKHVAFLDFQLLDHTVLANADLFFRQFCAWLTDELNLEDGIDEHWAMPLGNSQRCTRYVGRHLMKQLDGPLLLAMDEVDAIFDTDFRSDFFGMLRSWHNNRATNPTWKRLDLALVTSTEPYQLIENLNQSPFNVGQVIELADFTPDQIHDLNARHGSPLSPDEERQLVDLVDGHPYLVRRALYLVASQRVTTSALFANATADRGPFGDHLRYHLFRLHNKRDLVAGLLQAITRNECQDERVFFRLRGAGLVRREGRAVLPRCNLYAEYFREHLHA